MNSNMDYYFKNPDTVEPYKIDKDKITTAISLIETTRIDHMHKDDTFKMRFAYSEQIPTSESAYFKQENSISKINFNLTDSKTELVPIATTERPTLKKKVSKKVKAKSSDNLVIQSIDLEEGEVGDANNLSISNNTNINNEDSAKLCEKPKKLKKKIKKNTESIVNENGQTDEQKSELTLKKKVKKKIPVNTGTNETLNADDEKPEKKVKKTKKKEEPKLDNHDYEQIEANAETNADGEKI